MWSWWGHVLMRFIKSLEIKQFIFFKRTQSRKIHWAFIHCWLLTLLFLWVRYIINTLYVLYVNSIYQTSTWIRIINEEIGYREVKHFPRVTQLVRISSGDWTVAPSSIFSHNSFSASWEKPWRSKDRQCRNLFQCGDN